MATAKKRLSKKRISLLILCLVLIGGGLFYYQSDYGYPLRQKFQSSPQYPALDQGGLMGQAIEMASPLMARADSASSKRMAITPPHFPGNSDFVGGPEQKVIKNASMTLEVEDTETSHKLVQSEIENLEGYITHLNNYEIEKGKYQYNMTIKVPSEKLETAIANLETLGIRKSKNFSANDITNQYIDTEGQLENLRNERGRLNELLDTKTDNLSDILSVEREITRVQQQITRLGRTQETRDNQINYSNLNLTLTPKTTIKPITDEDWNPQKTWTESVNKLFSALRLIAEKAIVVVAFIPIWLPAILVFWFLKYLLWDE